MHQDAPPQAPDMELISGLMSYGVELTSGEGLNALEGFELMVMLMVTCINLFLPMDPATFGGTLYLDTIMEVFTAQQIKITTSAGSEGSRTVNRRYLQLLFSSSYRSWS